MNTTKPVYSPEAYNHLDVASFRKRFPHETDKYSDKQLFDVVMGTEDDMDDNEWSKLFVAFNPMARRPADAAVEGDVDPDSTHRTIIGSRGSTQAMAFARKGGEGFSTLLGTIATAKETERKGPIEVFLFFEQHFTSDERANIPVPGSKKEEAGNKPFDKYTVEVKTKDGNKKVPGSWFTDVVKSTPEYGDIQDRLEAINGDGDAPEEILNMRKTGLALQEKKRLAQRVSDMRTVLVKGAMLWHHAEEIATINPDRIRVKMPFKKVYVLDADGERIPLEDGSGNFKSELQVTGNTIRLQDPTAELEDKVYSVSEFIALKPAKLVGKNEDQTLVTLEATKARAPKTAKNKGRGDQEIKVPTTVEGLLNLFNVAATALDNQTEQGAKLNALLYAAFAAKGAKAEDAIETVGDFCLAADSIWTQISATYTNIKARKAAAINAQAQALREVKKA